VQAAIEGKAFAIMMQRRLSGLRVQEATGRAGNPPPADDG